ncbi:MAG: hypothetical protein P1V20_12530 [Verrucomicrobiales bacterium]|nr:hypothetical protein [Verrucomicrobiales bacterium]
MPYNPWSGITLNTDFVNPALYESIVESRSWANLIEVFRKLEYPLEPFRRSAEWHSTSLVVNGNNISERKAAEALLEDLETNFQEKNEWFYHRLFTYRALVHFELGNFSESKYGLLQSLRYFGEMDDGRSLLRSNDVAVDYLRCLQLLWQFLKIQKLDVEDLAQYQKALSDIHYQETARRSSNALSQSNCEVLEHLKWSLQSRSAEYGRRNFHLPGGKRAKIKEHVLKARKWLCLHLMPNGWVDYNKIHLCRQLSENREYHGAGFSPYTFIAEELIRFQFCSDPRPTEAFIRCAIVAVASERFRLENGKFPTELEEMIPDILAVAVEDPYSPGSDLIYKLGRSGPVIYSIGPNGKDDGGTPRAPIAEGDLVWRYELPAGFAFEDYILH